MRRVNVVSSPVPVPRVGARPSAQAPARSRFFARGRGSAPMRSASVGSRRRGGDTPRAERGVRERGGVARREHRGAACINNEESESESAHVPSRTDNIHREHAREQHRGSDPTRRCRRPRVRLRPVALDAHRLGHTDDPQRRQPVARAPDLGRATVSLSAARRGRCIYGLNDIPSRSGPSSHERAQLEARGLGAVRPEILRKVVAHAIGRRRPGGPAQANAAELPPVVPTQQPTGALPAGRSTRS